MKGSAMDYMELIDLLISAVVVGAVAYFFWKFRQIDTHATKTELAEAQAEIMEFIPTDVITSEDCGQCAGKHVEEIFTRHAEEQRTESQRQTDSIMDRISEVKTDLGRELGEVKKNIGTLDERFHNHITKDKKEAASA